MDSEGLHWDATCIDFANGFVLVNELAAATQVVTLPAGMVDNNGNPVSIVTQGHSQGGICQFTHWIGAMAPYNPKRERGESVFSGPGEAKTPGLFFSLQDTSLWKTTKAFPFLRRYVQ